MASRVYRLDFVPNDARSTDPGELSWEIRTGPAGTGVLLASGTATAGATVSVVITDTSMSPGTNTRYIRVFDGALNAHDTAYTVEAVEEPPEETLEGSVIGVGFVFEWRDHRYNLIADLTPAVESATVTLINERAVARTARLKLDPAQFPEGFDPDVHRVSIRARFLREGLEAQYPLGLFRLDVAAREFSAADDPSEIQTATGVESEPVELLEVDGADMTSHLEEQLLSEPYVVEAGTVYTDEVESLIESVTFLDFTGQARPLRYEIPSSDLTTPVAWTWEPGTSVLQVINDLLAGINYHPLWADETGVLRTRERALPWDEPVSVAYSTVAEPRLIVSPFVRRLERGVHANQILVTVGDPARAELSSARKNADPDSVIGLGSTGAKPLLRRLQLPYAADSQRLQEYADYELALSAAKAERAELRTTFDPRRTNRETYTVTIEGVEEESRWVVLGWSLSMTVGTIMLHDIGRAEELKLEDLDV